MATSAGSPVRGRSTRQRTAVSAALDEVDEFRSAQELHDMLKHRGDSVGLTTVYRTLQSLADAGEVDVLRTSDGEAVYRRCSTDDHHHHLVCRACGKAVEVEGPAVEKWADQIATSTASGTWRTRSRSSGRAATAPTAPARSTEHAPDADTHENGPPPMTTEAARSRCSQVADRPSGSGAAPNLRSRFAYSRHASHRFRRSKSGHRMSWKTISA